MTEPVEALIAVFKAEATIAALCADRVYGIEIPQHEIERQTPRKFLLIVESGGIEHNRFLPVAEPRFDLWSFGETYHEAGKLDRAVYDVLRIMDRKTISGTLLHGAALSGGPFPVRDSDTGWPAKWRSIVLQLDARAVT